MRGLLVVAHGSRREESNEEIGTLTEQIRGVLNEFELIEFCFLELATPSIFDGAQLLVNQGATHLSVFPYFLVAGKHVTKDIPAEVDEVRLAHPTVEVELLEYFGAKAALAEVVVAQLQSAAKTN